MVRVSLFYIICFCIIQIFYLSRCIIHFLNSILGKNQEERKFLLRRATEVGGACREKKNVLENKQSDVATWRAKQDAWSKLCADFNSEGLGPPRSTECLRGKYEKLKKTTRQKSAQLKKDAYKTGGGGATAPPLNDVEEKIKSMILLSVDGLVPSIGDSDYVSSEYTLYVWSCELKSCKRIK